MWGFLAFSKPKSNDSFILIPARGVGWGGRNNATDSLQPRCLMPLQGSQTQPQPGAHKSRARAVPGRQWAGSPAKGQPASPGVEREEQMGGGWDSWRTDILKVRGPRTVLVETSVSNNTCSTEKERGKGGRKDGQEGGGRMDVPLRSCSARTLKHTSQF